MIANLEFIAAWVSTKVSSERGASLVEYALLVALIAAVCIGAVQAFGTNAADTFGTAASAVSTGA